MRIDKLLTSGRPTFSFEIYPPKTEEGWNRLLGRLQNLSREKIDFVSVTITAGRLPQTLKLAGKLIELGFNPLVHLTSQYSTKDMDVSLLILERLGVANVLLLRGDQPASPPSAFPTVRDLVKWVKTNSPMCIGVAGYPEFHPEAKSSAQDLKNLEAKLKAGADWVLAQLFFQNSAFYRFQEKLVQREISQPVLPGLMPLLETKNLEQFRRFGTQVPQELVDAFSKADGPKTARQVGLDHTIAQARDLLAQGARGIHLYTKNQLSVVPTILAAIQD